MKQSIGYLGFSLWCVVVLMALPYWLMVAFVMGAVLCGGAYGIYRTGGQGTNGMGPG